VTSLLDRLRQDLPGEWQQAEPAKWGEAWYADPIRTVSLQIGERTLLVSFRCTGGWVGQRGDGIRYQRWPDLITGTRAAAAQIVVDHARIGSPIPTFPTWATSAIPRALANRHNTLTRREICAREDLVRVGAERAILSTLTLGA